MPSDTTFMDTYTHGAHMMWTCWITGVGMVATAARALAQWRGTVIDLALNLGRVRQLRPVLRPGTVVHVLSDRLAEMGAEDGDRFMTLQELELPGESEFVNA